MPTTETTLQTLAEEAAGWFETARRDPDDDETAYVRTKDGAPDWVRDLVHAAHGGMLPDDWRYDCIRAAVDWLAENGDAEDGEHDFADGYVAVYTSDLLAWAASHDQRLGYVDEAREEYGIPGTASIDERLRIGQYAEAREVFASVLASLQAREVQA